MNILRSWSIILMLLAQGIPGSGQWYGTGPEAAGNLRAVWFKNDTLGLIMGHDGLVLRSTDRGESWDPLPGDLNIDFFDFQFIDDSLIHAYGSDKIYFSVDSGSSWQEKAALPAGAELVYFLDPETGFAGGNIQGLYRTPDGGKNWTLVWDHPADNVTYSEQNGMDFLNDTLGYACGRSLKIGLGGCGNIIRTHDRGMSWSIVWESPTNETVSDPVRIQVLNDSNVITVGRYFDLVRSDDAGENWTIIPFHAPDPESWFGMEARAMFALHPDTVFLTSEVTVWPTKSGGMHKRKILRTTDRGENWIVQYLEDVECVDCSLPLMGDRLFMGHSFGICTGSNLILRTENLGGDIHIRDTVIYEGVENTDGNPAGIRIFPNPATQFFWVQSNTDQYTSIQVYTMSGTLLREYPFSRTIRIDLVDYPPGFYLLRFPGRDPRYLRLIKSE